MALLTLTQRPTARQRALFELWLGPSDAVLLRQDARPLLWQPNPTRARGYVRESDARALGGQPHADWTLICDDEWVALTLQHQPLVNW